MCYPITAAVTARWGECDTLLMPLCVPQFPQCALLHLRYECTNTLFGRVSRKAREPTEVCDLVWIGPCSASLGICFACP